MQLDPGFSAPTTRLNDVETPSESPASVEANAGGGIDRAAGVAVHRVNGLPDTPLGSQQTNGPTDLTFPAATATVIITITTP